MATLIYQYFQLVLSWPTITAAISLTVVFTFRSDIKLLMSRIAKIRFPGGSEVSTQLERQTEAGEGKPKPEVPKSEENQIIPSLTPLNLSSDQFEAVRQLYNSERANALLWEYRYLNYFLALNTQRVLDWFATVPPASRSLFDNIWTPILPLVDERNAVLTALNAHYLLRIENDLLTISPKGMEYAQWRGPLPNPAV